MDRGFECGLKRQSCGELAGEPEAEPCKLWQLNPKP